MLPDNIDLTENGDFKKPIGYIRNKQINNINDIDFRTIQSTLNRRIKYGDEFGYGSSSYSYQDYGKMDTDDWGIRGTPGNIRKFIEYCNLESGLLCHRCGDNITNVPWSNIYDLCKSCSTLFYSGYIDTTDSDFFIKSLDQRKRERIYDESTSLLVRRDHSKLQHLISSLKKLKGF